MPPGGAYRSSLNGGAAPTVRAPRGSGPGGAFRASQGGGSKPKGKSGGGGLFGAVGRAFSQGAKDLEHVAVNSPAGVAELAVGDYHALGHAIHHPLGDKSLTHYVHHPTDLFALTEKGKQQKKALEETAKHPLRHPGLTLLYTLPAASGVLRAAEVGTGATIGERTLRVNGLEVHPEGSRSALGRAVQHGTDAALQAAAKRKPHGAAAKVLQRKVGRVVTAEAKQSERQAKGPGLALIKVGHKLKPGEQKALQLVAEQAPVAERIATAEKRVSGARTDLARAQHQAELDLLHEAKPHLVEGAGRPTLASPKLQKVYDRMAKVAADRETLLKSLNLLTEESAASRKTNAGRVAIGAQYVKPTPAREGVPSKQLVSKRKQVAKLQQRSDRLRAQVLAEGARIPGAKMIGLKAVGEGLPRTVTRTSRNGAPVEETFTRARTVEEAQQRLDQLEKEHNKQLDAMAAAEFGPIDKAEVARRNVERGKAKRSNARVNKSLGMRGMGNAELHLRRTVKEERRVAIERKVEDFVARNPDHPVAQRWAARVNEIDALRAALNPDPEELFGAPEPKPALKEALHPSLEEHENGQTRLTAGGEQASLLPHGNGEIPTTAAPSPAELELERRRLAEQPPKTLEQVNKTLDAWLNVRVAAHHAREAGTLSVRDYKKVLAQVRNVEDRLEPIRREHGKTTSRAFELEAGPGGQLVERGAQAQPEPVEHPLGTVTETRTVNPRTYEKRTIRGPGRVITPRGGARLESLGAHLSHLKTELAAMEKAAGRRVTPTGVVGSEHFRATPEAVRIPDVATRRGVRSLNRQGQVGAQGSVGHLQPPGSVRHPFTGRLRGAEHASLNPETGKIEQVSHNVRRQDTTALVGESSLEAAKYHGLLHVHELVRQAVQPAPIRPDDVAVRLDNLSSNASMPLLARQFLSDPEEFFRHHTPAEEATALETVRQMLFFPGRNEGGGWELDPKMRPEVRDEFQRLYDEGQIGWVPKRILGELGQPNAPLRAVAPGKAVSSVDAINNASRFAVLYLKPAYAVPNILGNLALNLIQQGWAAPRNLAQAARIVQRLDKADYAGIDAAMGEGFARAISAHGTGPLAHLVDLAAAGWSKVVDTPFRRAAWIHEARREGFKTPAQIHELLTRDVHDPQFLRVGVRANRDAIDYERLTPVEREVIRRVVFFYPWVKGSTMFAGRFLREHPVQAGVVGALGQQGQQYSEQGFGGPLPSRLEGLVPFGSGRALNPASAALFQTPAQVFATGQGLASGNISDAANVASFFTPALTLAEAIRERRDPATGIPFKPGTSALDVARKELLSGLPQARLYSTISEALAGGNPQRLYPPSVGNALGNFLLGGIYPRTINKPELRREYLSEQRRLKYGR